MTETMNKVAQKALSLVGQGYIYGAKGQTCSPAFRKQQAQQYPEQADNILNVGQKWDGMPVWDCAQLTRAVAKEAGVALPSGATSQWNKGEWARKGDSGTLPQNEVCFLFRRESGSNSVMAHTGVYLGDGTEVDARGTRYGVLHQTVADFAWTHWASPFGDENKPEDKEKEGENMEPYKAIVMASIGSTVNLRDEPGGSVQKRVPIGTTVEVQEIDGQWARVVDPYGMTGWMMIEYLSIPDEQANEVTITLPRDVAKAVYDALFKGMK